MPRDRDTSAPIDRAHLARYTLANVDLEAEVLALFAAQAPLYVRQLEAAATAKAWRDAAHTLKGSALAIGAWTIADRAAAAESVAPADADRRAAVVAAIVDAVDAACRYIAALRQAA